jgi:hypothetical protein
MRHLRGSAVVARRVCGSALWLRRKGDDATSAADETVAVSGLRLGVIADPHLALERVEDTGWHNPFRLADAHLRLDAALAHPLLDGTDVVLVLGDLAHFGDRTSLRHVVEAVVAAQRPAVLLSGNHDVLTPGVRLENEVVDRGAGLVVSPFACRPETQAVKAFESAGAGLAVHEVTGLSDRELLPFDVTGRRLASAAGSGSAADAHPAGGLDVLLTHFPVLTLEDRCREAELLYSGHLDILAPSPSVLPAADRPVVVLSGHLHLRGVTTAANVLQLVFAALVEPPYEVAVVEIDVDEPSLAYRCASVFEPQAERLPVLDPPSGRWVFDPDSVGWSSSS